MALATLSGVEITGIGPPWTLLLSHSPLLKPTTPNSPILPLYVRPASDGSKTDERAWHSVNAQDVFSWFRHAGPLLSVRTNVNLGHDSTVCLVEYWKPEHARHARQTGRSLHPTLLSTMTPFALRVYDPWNLHCCVSDSTIESGQLMVRTYITEFRCAIPNEGPSRGICQGIQSTSCRLLWLTLCLVV